MLRKYEKFIIDKMTIVVMLATMTAGILRLGTMQTEHLIGFGAGLISFFFGLTSLLYARARAALGENIQPRILEAAEESLKATLIGTVGVILATWLFATLSESYLPYRGSVFHPTAGASPDALPMIAAFIITMGFVTPVWGSLRRAVMLTLETMDPEVSKST